MFYAGDLCDTTMQFASGADDVPQTQFLLIINLRRMFFQGLGPGLLGNSLKRLPEVESGHPLHNPIEADAAYLTVTAKV